MFTGCCPHPSSPGHSLLVLLFPFRSNTLLAPLLQSAETSPSDRNTRAQSPLSLLPPHGRVLPRRAHAPQINDTQPNKPPLGKRELHTQPASPPPNRPRGATACRSWGSGPPEFPTVPSSWYHPSPGWAKGWRGGDGSGIPVQARQSLPHGKDEILTASTGKEGFCQHRCIAQRSQQSAYGLPASLRINLNCI